MRSCSLPLKEVIVARFDVGEDLFLSIKKIVSDHEIKAGSFTLIGAVDKAKYGFYHPRKKTYTISEWKPTTTSSPALEILSCVGTIAQLEDETIIHGHITLAGEKGEIMGGHLLEGCCVNPTAELVIFTFDGILLRKRDPALNLALLSI